MVLGILFLNRRIFLIFSHYNNFKKKGDYNGDGSVGVPDIMTAVAILNGQPVGSEIIDVDDPEVIEKLDLNNDGKITIEDIQLMIRKVLGNNYEG